jgi:hypothetical protein
MEQIWEFSYTTKWMLGLHAASVQRRLAPDISGVRTRDSVLSHGSNTVQLHLNHLNQIRFPFDESSIFNSPMMFYRFKFKLSTSECHTVEELTGK